MEMAPKPFRKKKEDFFVFWRSKGRGAMAQGHENKGNKTRGKKKQK